MRAKDRRKLQILEQVDSDRSNQALQAFNRMKSRELSQAVELALNEGLENESLRYSLKTHHLSKKGDMPMKAIHALLMKQPKGFDFYEGLRTPIMQKLSRDPAMLEQYVQYAQNATPGWDDTTFKEIVKTAPNGEDIFGFIGVMSYDDKRKVTPHIVFDKDRNEALHKAHQTLVHNIMDKNLKDVTPQNHKDGYDVIRVHHDGNVSYHRNMSVHDAARTLSSIADEFGLAVSNSKFRPAMATGNVTYSFEVSILEYEDDPAHEDGESPVILSETFTKTASSRHKARRAAAISALDSRMLFDTTGFTLLPQTGQTRAKICVPAA